MHGLDIPGQKDEPFIFRNWKLLRMLSLSILSWGISIKGQSNEILYKSPWRHYLIKLFYSNYLFAWNDDQKCVNDLINLKKIFSKKILEQAFLSVFFLNETLILKSSTRLCGIIFTLNACWNSSLPGILHSQIGCNGVGFGLVSQQVYN